MLDNNLLKMFMEVKPFFLVLCISPFVLTFLIYGLISNSDIDFIIGGSLGTFCSVVMLIWISKGGLDDKIQKESTK